MTGSNGTTTYQFLRDNETVISLSNSTYVHQNIQTSDTGNYTCTATINGVVSLKSNGFEKAVVGKCLTLIYMPCSNKLSNIHRLFSLHIFQLFHRHERMQPFMSTKWSDNLLYIKIVEMLIVPSTLFPFIPHLPTFYSQIDLRLQLWQLMIAAQQTGMPYFWLAQQTQLVSLAMSLDLVIQYWTLLQVTHMQLIVQQLTATMETTHA